MVRVAVGSQTIQHFLGIEDSVFGPTPGLGSLWDVGLRGDGYLLSTLGDESPFEYRAVTVRGAPAQKPRIDTAGEPGEQTLEQWWARAQHSWHGGAGQKVFDSQESDRTRFWKSKGVDIWTKGQVSLLHDVDELDSSAGDDLFLLTDAGYLFMSKAGDVLRIPDLDVASVDWSGVGGPSTSVKGMTSDGNYLYVCWRVSDGAGIWRQDMVTWTGAAKINNLSPDVMEFVKARLIAASGASLYDLDLTTVVTPDPIFTYPIDSWVWTAITGSATSIYCAGYSGERSEIYAIRLDATDLQAGMTLGVPTSVWQAPDGEIIHSIEGYLGKAIMIGTSRGLRLALIANVEGELDVSQLLVETPHPIRCIEPQGDYAWFGWSYHDAESSGLGRIDLSTLAYATDLMTDKQGITLSIAAFDSRTIFSVISAAPNVVVAESHNRYVPSGWYETGEIRFDTFEKKAIQFFDALMIGEGTFDMAIKRNQEATFAPFLSLYPVGEVTERVGLIGTRFNLRITLYSGEVDDVPYMVSPLQLEWRLRGEPNVDGRSEYMLPLMTYDYLVALNNQTIGYDGMAKFIRERLFFLWKTNANFMFDSRDFGSFRARITGIEFKSFTPPKGFSGMGGITLVIIHEQE